MYFVLHYVNSTIAMRILHRFVTIFLVNDVQIKLEYKAHETQITP